MIGYWNVSAKTAEVIDTDGFMHAGDFAFMDEGGYLSIVGRSKDLVIRGGENVYPCEVEAFLFTHPDIIDTQVMVLPDAKLGEELCAWVQLRDLGRRVTASLVPGGDRRRQGDEVRQGHRRVPDDRHWQGPEVQDARHQHNELGLQDAAAIVTA